MAFKGSERAMKMPLFFFFFPSTSRERKEVTDKLSSHTFSFSSPSLKPPFLLYAASKASDKGSTFFSFPFFIMGEGDKVMLPSSYPSNRKLF